MLSTATRSPLDAIPDSADTLWVSLWPDQDHVPFEPLNPQQPPRLSLALADDDQTNWAQNLVAAKHYLKTPVDARCNVLAYIVLLAGHRIGCLIFGRPESTRVGGWYGDVEEKLAGRCRLSRWEVLNLARIYISPVVQPGGAWCRPGIVPGFFDRHGLWHCCLTTRVILMALECVLIDYCLAFPPVFLDQPYQIAEILSYCDSTQPRHRGTVYRSAGFRLERTNAEGLQTFARPVRRLTQGEDAWVQYFATHSLRSKRYRSQNAAMHLAHQAALF
jgi:hypothetical protein